MSGNPAFADYLHGLADDYSGGFGDPVGYGDDEEDDDEGGYYPDEEDDEDDDDSMEEQDPYSQFGDEDEYNPFAENEEDEEGDEQGEGDGEEQEQGGGEGGGQDGLGDRGAEQQQQKEQRKSQSAAQDKNDPNLKFDTVFLKKYYRRIRNHILTQKLFDKLNISYFNMSITYISTPIGYIDYIIVPLIKPKYTLPTRHFDAVIEFVLLDDGPISTLCAGLMDFVDVVLKAPGIKQLGDAIIAACKAGGIFNNTLMSINQGIVGAKAKKEATQARAKSREHARQSRIDAQAARGSMGAERERLERSSAEHAKKSKQYAAFASRREKEGKVMANDFRKDRKAHGLGAGHAGLAAGVSGASIGGLGAGIKAGAGAAFNESGVGRVANAAVSGAGAFANAREDGRGVLGSLGAGIGEFGQALKDEPGANEMSDRAFSIGRNKDGGFGINVSNNTYDRQQGGGRHGDSHSQMNVNFGGGQGGEQGGEGNKEGDQSSSSQSSSSTQSSDQTNNQGQQSGGSSESGGQSKGQSAEAGSSSGQSQGNTQGGDGAQGGGDGGGNAAATQSSGSSAADSQSSANASEGAQAAGASAGNGGNINVPMSENEVIKKVAEFTDIETADKYLTQAIINSEAFNNLVNAKKDGNKDEPK
jgi:hypothetical protein